MRSLAWNLTSNSNLFAIQVHLNETHDRERSATPVKELVKNMPTVIQQLHKRAKRRPRRIVFPETQDSRVIEAASVLADQQLVIPVLIERDDLDDPDLLEGFETATVSDPELARRCADQLYENRKHKGLSRDAAKDAVKDPLLFAALLVKIGFADGAVAGSIATTPSVIRAALYGIGTLPGRKTVSSFFLMQLSDGRAMTYSDCGVIPDPNAEQLSEIAIAAADSHQKLTGEEPKVALLSFSTLGSADHPRVTKVRDALAIVRSTSQTLCIDGELQFDAAIIPAIAKNKAPDSIVAGHANVLIFPDLDSGNIAYKITERLAGAKALGPLIQGLERPFMDLSRGCNWEDIVDVGVIASILSS